MSKDVSVLISEELVQELSVFLKEKGDDRGISKACEDALRYWLENMEWKYDELHQVARNGVRWKEVFLPHGTRLKMTYKKESYYADVVDDQIIYDDEEIKSPNQFATMITSGSVNAWVNIELLFPNSKGWELAQDVRLREKAK